MVIVDTSVWIEFLKGKEPYFEELGQLLEDGEVVSVECVFAELLQGAKNLRERQLLFEYWNNLPKFPEKNILLEAGLLSGVNKWHSKGLGLMDSVIFVLASEYKIPVWTLDKKLLSIFEQNELYSP